MNSKELTRLRDVLTAIVLSGVKHIGLLMLIVIVLIAFGFFFGGWR